MAKKAKRPPRAEPPPSPTPEASALKTLAWGAGALILGLAVVGVGADEVGMVPVLAGLLLLIYGIHKYGRLGPEGETWGEAEAARDVVSSGVWMGGLIAVAGLAVALGAAGGGAKVVIAYGAVLGGGFQVLRGLSALSRLREAPTMVEKRRRMNKSAPP